MVIWQKIRITRYNFVMQICIQSFRVLGTHSFFTNPTNSHNGLCLLDWRSRNGFVDGSILFSGAESVQTEVQDYFKNKEASGLKSLKILVESGEEAFQKSLDKQSKFTNTLFSLFYKKTWRSNLCKPIFARWLTHNQRPAFESTSDRLLLALYNILIWICENLQRQTSKQSNTPPAKDTTLFFFLLDTCTHTNAHILLQRLSAADRLSLAFSCRPPLLGFEMPIINARM